MAFSLTYAFGRMGRHVRKISREARSFVGTKFRNLDPSPFRDSLFAQYFAIDATVFHVFYSEEGDPLYPIHLKYGNKLIDATGCDYLRLCRVYSCGIVVGQSSANAPATEQQVATTLGILRVIDFVYGGSEPEEEWWAPLVLKPDTSIISAAVCQGIARVLQVDPKDKTSFGNDWLSLIPRINAATNALLATPDWAKVAASMLNSCDFGGSGP